MRLWRRCQQNDRGVLSTSAVVLLVAALLLLRRDANAQVLQGTVRLRDDSVTIDAARVVAQDRRGKTLADAMTDAAGRYVLRFGGGAAGVPFRLTITRIGLQPTMSDEFSLLVTDTVSADLWVRPLAQNLTEVSTEVAPSLNTQRLRYATRRGWKVFDPETIEARSQSSLGLNELIRSLGAPGLMVPNRNGDCIKSTRTGQCLAVIIDNVLITGGVHLNPRDIYFLAVVGSSEARLEWGDRAAYGALAIYTRMSDDLKKP